MALIPYLCRMRWLSFIMASFVFMLSMQEGIASMLLSDQLSNSTACCASSCTSNTEQKKSTDQSDDGTENHMCNPFQACGSCSLVITKVQYCNISIRAFHAPLYSNYTFSHSSSFISDFWQPPKFV